MLSDIINRDIVSVKPSTSILEVARLMEKENVGCVLVLDDGRLDGIVTDRDIVVRCISKNMHADQCMVEDVMTESPVCCRETDGIFDCIQKMRDSQVRRMPVVDDNDNVVGVVSFGDLVAMLSKEFSELTSTTTVREEIEHKAA